LILKIKMHLGHSPEKTLSDKKSIAHIWVKENPSRTLRTTGESFTDLLLASSTLEILDVRGLWKVSIHAERETEGG